MHNMKIRTIVGVIILSGELVFPCATPAQGTTYISNLGQSPINSSAVASDSWLALSFSTGTNTGGYLLDSIRLQMANATGGPTGFTAMLYSAIGSQEFSPGNSLAALSGLSPIAGGTYGYFSATNLMLSPSTAYFIVLTAGTAVSDGVYEIADSNVFPLTYNPIGGWHAPLGATHVDNYQSSNGLSWGVFGSYPEFSINATAVPEPSAYVLLGLGGSFLFGLRKYFRESQSPNASLEPTTNVLSVPLARAMSSFGGGSIPGR